MDNYHHQPSTTTINLYNLHLQQQQEQMRHLQQYPQQRYHQTAPNTMHDHSIGKQRLLSTQQELQHTYQAPYYTQQDSNDYYNPYNNHHYPPPSIKLEQQQDEEEDEALLIDCNSSISSNRLPIVTTNMHAREENTSQSSNSTSVFSSISTTNTIATTSPPTKRKPSNKRKQMTKYENGVSNDNVGNKKSMILMSDQPYSKKPSTKIGAVTAAIIRTLPAPPVEKKKHRRESHNAVERRRRNNINDNIKSLGQLLPDNLRDKKLNKGTILKGSVLYIQMLNNQLSQYKKRLESLQYEAANFSITPQQQHQ